jgi:hypothetical protein
MSVVAQGWLHVCGYLILIDAAQPNRRADGPHWVLLLLLLLGPCSKHAFLSIHPGILVVAGIRRTLVAIEHTISR